MSDFLMAELAKELTPDASLAQNSKLRQAKVIARDATHEGYYNIQLAGSTQTINKVASMVRLVANDIVWVAQQGNLLIIINHIADNWHVVGASGEPAFSGSWVNFGSGNPNAMFTKVAGITFLRGIIKSGSMGGASAFTLPVRYRPLSWVYKAVPSSNAYGQLEIGPSGQVNPTVGSNVWFSLECSFIAEQ